MTDGFRPFSEIIDDTAPLASWYYGICDWVFGRSYTARHVVTLIILFLQSCFWGIMLINRKVFTENTFVPSLIFSLLTLGAFDLLTLHADVAAFGFSLLMLNSIYKEIEFGGQRDETILNLGIFVGIASMLNFSFIVYLPGSAIILLMFTTNRLRAYLLLVFGTLLPHFVLCSYYFANDAFAQLWHSFYGRWLVANPTSWVDSTSLLILSAIPLFYLLISFLTLIREARFTKYQSQILRATYLWFVISIIGIWLTPDRRPQSLIVLIPSASFVMSQYLLMIRRVRYANFNTWMILLGVIAIASLARYGYIPQVNYEGFLLTAKEDNLKAKRVLDLDNDFTVYYDNTLSPPFVDHEMTRAILNEPDYYETVLLVDKLFREDPPEVILDKDHIIEPYFERIPYLGDQYTRTDDGYLRKPSN